MLVSALTLHNFAWLGQDLPRLTPKPSKLWRANHQFKIQTKSNSSIQNEMDQTLQTWCNFNMNTMNNFKLQKLGSKNQLSYDWLSMALIPIMTQRINQTKLQSMKCSNRWVEDTKMPKFVDPKIPNSSYLKHVDSALYRVQRSTILRTLI